MKALYQARCMASTNSFAVSAKPAAPTAMRDSTESGVCSYVEVPAYAI